MAKKDRTDDNLTNVNEDTVLAALESLKEKGKESNIPAILDLIMLTDNEGIRRGALDLMRDIKLKNAYQYVKGYIEKYRGHKHLHLLVALCWEAGFNCDADLIFFTDLAVKEEFQITLEVLTVVEHMTSAQKEDVKASVKLIDSSAEDNETKMHLLSEIKNVIKAF